MLDINFDNSFRRNGISLICGCDEAGRGPLAGPVVAAACILPEGCIIEGLDDSKKLSEKKRDILYDRITSDKDIIWCAASATPEEVDKYNILSASLLAMRRAIEGLSVVPDYLLVDGNVFRGFEQSGQAVVGGDAKSMSIAAASIIAKVVRDRICVSMHDEYPLYNFGKHKGYPTKEHKLLVYEHGPCPLHRKSFLSFLERDKDKLEAELQKKHNG